MKQRFESIESNIPQESDGLGAGQVLPEGDRLPIESWLSDALKVWCDDHESHT